MIVLRFIVHPNLQSLEPKVKIQKSINIMGAFIYKVAFAIPVLFLTGFILGSIYKGTPLSPLVHTKEAIWTVMVIIFVVIFNRHKKAKTSFENGEIDMAGNYLSIIPKLLHINIVLGLVAIFMGVVFHKGF
jgi:uncharacterized membrane protein